MYNILIVDDDKSMRLLLRKTIERKAGFKVIGEAENCKTALEEAALKRPDIVYMDIELPDGNGVECSRSMLQADPKMIVIFATAHEEYMPEAFELYAFDYMVKPFSIDRIIKTLDLIESTHQKKIEYNLRGDLDNYLDDDRLTLKYKNEIVFIDLHDIIFIEREERRTVIYTSDSSYYTNETLSEIEQRLKSKMFLRSHRSYIINLKKISKIYQYGRWTYLVEFKNTKKDALITSAKLEELESRLH